VPRFAYVANLGSFSGGGELSAFTVNATTGQLRHNGYVITTSGGGLTSVAVDPSNRFVYTTNTSGVWGFGINAANGTLTSLSATAFTDGGANPVAIAIDPLGRFVFVANGGGVSAYKIQASGALQPVSAPVGTGGTAVALCVDPSGRFVYVANQAANGVAQFSIDATSGALSSLTPASVSTGASAPLGIGADPSGRAVYVTFAAATSNVLGFTIGANGTLTQFQSGPVSAGDSPRSVAFDAAGRFAYFGNQNSNDVTVFSIVANGVLSSPTSAATKGSQTWTAALDPSGQFAYAVNQGSGDVALFSVNPGNGSLSWQGSVAARYSPGSIAFTRGTSGAITYTPRFAYTANLGSSDISAFRIDAGSGALTLIGTPVSSGGTNPFPVAADPSGQFLYVGHEMTSNVQAFKIDAASGAPSAIGTPVPTNASQADGLTVDPSGRFIYAGNVGNNISLGHTVSLAVINTATGALGTFGTPVDTIDFQPFSPGVDPSGRFLYTANFFSSSVTRFLIDPSNGAISGAQAFALVNASSPFSLAVSPSGRFLYVANRVDPNSGVGNGNVSVFAINLGVGSLSEISGSPYPAGAGPRSIAVHPSGRYIYVANENDSTVTAYQADPSTGVLTVVTGSPFAVGGAMRPLTVDPSGRFLYAAQTGAAKVSAFTIDSNTGALGPVVGGALVPIGGAPVPTGTTGANGLSPFTITTTGTIQ
jgi:6-phosphogluconolactonase (cycloisomerase 2 family)